MLYLAQIARRWNKRKRTATLNLLAVQRGQSWTLIDLQTIETEDAGAFSDQDMALVEVSANRKILKVLDAAVELPKILDALSKRLYLLEQSLVQQEEEWELRRHSLKVQAQELSARKNSLDAREEQLKLEELATTKALNEAKEWAGKLQRARAKLQSEWESLKEQKAKLEAKSE